METRRAKMPRTPKNLKKIRPVFSAFAAAFCLLTGNVGAQEYPAKGVSLIVPFPAGGGVDVVGRVVAQKLTDALGQQVLVLNRPGAGSVIGVRDGAKAA